MVEEGRELRVLSSGQHPRTSEDGETPERHDVGYDRTGILSLVKNYCVPNMTLKGRGGICREKTDVLAISCVEQRTPASSHVPWFAQGRGNLQGSPPRETTDQALISNAPSDCPVAQQPSFPTQFLT